MAQHKAPTAVTFATLENRSGLGPFVQRFWKLFALVAVAAGAVIIYSVYSSQLGKTVLEADWDSLNRLTRISEGSLLVHDAKADEIIAGEPSLRGSQAGPWALWIAATQASAAGEWDKAVQAVQLLKQNYPNHQLVTEKQPLGPDGAALSMADDLLRRYAAQKAWRSSHADMFANPEPPADSPRVRIKTDKGDIVVALYAKEAPKTVENFLKLCRDGFYAGTKFHRVLRNSMILGGDPNTKTEDRTTWGLGGPEYKLDREENGLHNFAGILGAWKTGADAKLSGSQFYITTADRLTADSAYVVFGKVVEGMDVVHTIENGELEADSSDRPSAPVVLLSAEVL